MASLHEITLGDGTTLKTALPPSRLAELGLPTRPVGTGALDPGSGATAELKLTPFTGSLSDFNAGQRSDAVSQIPGLGQALRSGSVAKSSAPTLNLSPGLPVESAESVAASDKAAAQAIDKSREGRERAPGTGSRFGATTKEIDTSGGAEQGYAPPAPRFVTVKAGNTKGADIRTGFSVKKSGATDYVPEYEENSANARINQRLAAQEQGDVTKDSLEVERGAAAEEEIRRQVAIEKARAREAEIQRRMAEAEQNQAALDAEHEQIQKLQVNPNQYWDSLGTGGKVLAAIGMIASGINSGMRGGPNQTAEFIYRAIRDDVAGQREKIEARRQGYNVKQTQLEKTAARLGGNLELASAQLEANQMALAAATMRKHAAEAGVAAVDPSLMALSAKLDQEAADMTLDVRGKHGAEVQESFAFIPDKTITIGGGPPVDEKDVHQLAADEEKAGIGEKEGDYGATLDLISQLPEGDLPTIDTRNAASRALRGTLNFLGGTGAGSAALDTPAERKAVAQVEKIKGKLRHDLSGAAVNPQEQEKLDQQLDGINTREGLQAFASDIQRRTDRRKSGIRAGFKSPVVQEYERRKGGYALPGRPPTLRGE